MNERRSARLKGFSMSGGKEWAYGYAYVWMKRRILSIARWMEPAYYLVI